MRTCCRPRVTIPRRRARRTHWAWSARARSCGSGPKPDGWAVGDRVCALLAGGGYAERVAVPAGQVLPVPVGVDLVEAGGLPEATCTVWSNLVMTAGLSAGSTVLVHGGGSGIGTMAIQVAARLGARVAATASRRSTLEACSRLGAEILIDYSSEDFVAALRTATDGRGADVILDLIGAKYLQRNVDALADGGRLVIIGLQGGTRAELDINALMRKRGGIIGTTLRSRPVTGPGSKAEIVRSVRDGLWPLIESGEIRPVVDAVLDMRDAGAAHRRMNDGGHVGKIVLRLTIRQPTKYNNNIFTYCSGKSALGIICSKDHFLSYKRS